MSRLPQLMPSGRTGHQYLERKSPTTCRKEPSGTRSPAIFTSAHRRMRARCGIR